MSHPARSRRAAVLAFGDCKMAMAEINFLCVLDNLRSNRLAPVLVKELARRVNLTGRWQAIATAGVRLVKPIGVAQYWHRSLNPKKLIAVCFSNLPSGMTMPGVIRLNKTLEQPVTRGIVAMEPKHVSGVTELLRYLPATTQGVDPVMSTLLLRPM